MIPHPETAASSRAAGRRRLRRGGWLTGDCSLHSGNIPMRIPMCIPGCGCGR